MKSANKAHFSSYVQSAHTKHEHFVNYDVIADKIHSLSCLVSPMPFKMIFKIFMYSG